MPFVSSIRGTFGPTSENRGVGSSSPFAELLRQDPNSQGLPTGGTISTAGGYRIHTFTSTGAATFGLGALSNLDVEYLVVAGGGGAGNNPSIGGGGGAGGYRTGSLTALAAPAPVVVGTAGSLGQNGGVSSFSTIPALGGGYGGNNAGGNPGGSGGGGSGPYATPGGSGTPGQGFAGGNCIDGVSVYQAGGGGGGASQAGTGGAGNPTRTGGNGGNGASSSITGTAVTRAGGGGGASNSGPRGTNGSGNPGHGAGGTTGSSASSGIVVVRYLTQ